MTRVLAISSWVGAGHVGLSAIGPALEALGVEALRIPTVILSNHKGWPAVAGPAVAPDAMGAMAEAMAANGWFADLDALLTGYMPSAAHAAAAAAIVERARGAAPALRVVVDPVLGDAPKGLYAAPDAAAAIRDRLVPLADDLTPNAFELGWLAGADLGDPVAAARRLTGPARVLITSPPGGRPGETGLLTVSADAARRHRAPQRAGVPHGVGDVFGALIAADPDPARALGRLQALIDASLGAPHLRFGDRAWAAAPPIPGVAL